MADNVLIDPGGTPTVRVATDEVVINGGTVHAQRVKLALGLDGQYQADLGGTASAPAVDALGLATRPITVVEATGSLVAQNDAVTLALKGQTVLALTVSGTWDGDTALEGSLDGGTTWVDWARHTLPTDSNLNEPLDFSTFVGGQWRANVAGLTDVRLRASAAMTGTATVRLRAGPGVAAPLVADNATALPRAGDAPTGLAVYPVPARVKVGFLASAGSEVTVNVDSTPTLLLELTGTWTGTIIMQADGPALTRITVPLYPLDSNGLVSGPAVTSVTGNGRWRCQVVGWDQAFVMASAWTSGLAFAQVMAVPTRHQAEGNAYDPLRTDPTGTTTQPVSGTVAATQSGGWAVSGTVNVAGTPTVAAQQAGAWNVGGTVNQAGAWNVGGTVNVAGTPTISIPGTPTVNAIGTVAATQSGSWTVAATQSGTWNIGTITTLNGTPTVSIPGTPSVNAQQAGAWNVGGTVNQAGTWNIGTVSMLSAGTVTVSGTPTVSIPGTPTVNAQQAGAWNVGGTVNQAGTWNIGTVSMLNAGTVTLSGTPTVSIPGTPTVNAQQSGAWNIGGTVNQAGAPWSVTVSGTPNVQGVVASDAPAAGNPLLNGARASAAAPTEVSTDGDAVALWATRRGALVTAPQFHAALDGGPWTHDNKGSVFTAAATGSALWTPAAGKRLCITSYQIQAGGATAGTVQVWFGTAGGTVFTRGTHKAIFDGEFAPSSTLKPGVVQTGPWVGDSVGTILRVTSNAAINPLTVSVWGYEF